MKILMGRRRTPQIQDNGANQKLEDRLNEIKRICKAGIYSRKEIAKKLEMGYTYATTLIKILLQRGDKLILKDMSRFSGDRIERERMIKSGDYSLREMAAKSGGVSWQAIYDYMIKHSMYDDWIEKRGSR